MSDKRKYKKILAQERKAWNKPTKPCSNKWKRRLAKSYIGSYYVIIL